MNQFEEELKKIDAISHYAAVTGYSFGGAGSSLGMFTIELKHWDERKGEGNSTDDIIARIYEIAANIPDATLFAMTPPIISGYGSGSGFELYIQDRGDGDLETFKGVADAYMEALSQRPEILMVYSPFETNYPQYTVEVDAAKCEQAGISPAEILETISGYYGGQYISNFNRFSKLYRVMQQAAPEYRATAESVNHIYVRVGEEMAPISQFVTLTRTYGPQTLDRFNLYNSITVNGTPADGYSSGDVINAIRKTAETALPYGYGFEFGGITREESNSGNNTIIIFAICIILVYLILSALYESFFIPFAILLAVPVGLMGSFLFAKILGLENNIYMQTGLIMLIGLLAKTAILLTEYATKRRQAGMSLTQAAYGAAKVRLRPILMTALTMIFGLLPLMFATGVGANGSRALASGAVGGMLVGTLVLLFIVPSLFIVFQMLQEKFRPLPPFGNSAEDWAIQAEIEEVKEKKRGKNNEKYILNNNR
jgi:HAE1 family hydrophobic/amphiphilic exporter-1